jgi:drug/metabolite transporter (DMT)-like permease
MLQIILLHALFGSSIPMSKFLLSMISPIWLTGIRMSLAGVILLGYNRIQKTHFTLDKKHWLYYVQIIFFGVYLKYVLRNWGLMHMSAAKMSFLLNISPFFAALFSYFAFNELLSKKQWGGLILGFLGIVPLLLLSSPAEKLMGELLVLSWPECAILFAVASHTYSIIVMRKLVRDNNYSAGMTNGIRMFGGGLLALVTAFMVEGSLVVQSPVTFCWWLAILIIVSNIMCHNFYIHLLKHYSATFLSFTDFLSPLFTAVYGWLFFNELITWHYYVSGIAIMVGLFLFYQDELFNTSTENKKTFSGFFPQWMTQLVKRA